MHAICISLCTVVWILGISGIGRTKPVVERGAFSYVVQKGCPYLAHYVRDNYYDYITRRRAATPVATATTHDPATLTTHINWVTHLYQQLVADYVPLELFKGLVACGKAYAMFAIDAPANLTAALNVHYHGIPGIGR